MYGKFAIALPPAMMRAITSGARDGVCARPPPLTLARTPAAVGWRPPRLNCLIALSICLSSRRISASDGAPGEISVPGAGLALRRGAAGAWLGTGARLAPRVPAGSGKLFLSSGSRVSTTPPAVACGVAGLALAFGVGCGFGVAGRAVTAAPEPDPAPDPESDVAAPHPASASTAAMAAARRREGASTRIRGKVTTDRAETCRQSRRDVGARTRDERSVIQSPNQAHGRHAKGAPAMLDQLEVPIVQAPMSGGPPTPELAAAVCGAGGS